MPKNEHIPRASRQLILCDIDKRERLERKNMKMNMKKEENQFNSSHFSSVYSNYRKNCFEYCAAKSGMYGWCLNMTLFEFKANKKEWVVDLSVDNVNIPILYEEFMRYDSLQVFIFFSRQDRFSFRFALFDFRFICEDFDVHSFFSLSLSLSSRRERTRIFFIAVALWWLCVVAHFFLVIQFDVIYHIKSII